MSLLGWALHWKACCGWEAVGREGVGKTGQMSTTSLETTVACFMGIHTDVIYGETSLSNCDM